MKISDEERQRRSDRARQMVADGRIGGPRPGSGRPRKKRAAELVAEEARENASLIVGAFKDTLTDNRAPRAVKVTAAKEWLAIENKEAQLQLAEDRQLEGASTDELIAMLSGKLAKLQPYVEGTASEVPTGELDSGDQAV